MVGTTAFQVIGIDYAGPIRYRIGKRKEGNAYILLFACSLSMATYLDLLPNLEMSECLDSLEWFIARRGRPEAVQTFTTLQKSDVDQVVERISPWTSAKTCVR